MQIFRALKTFIRYYFHIVPIYLLVNFIRGISNGFVPWIGQVVLLPFKVVIAHAMLTAHIDPKNKDKNHFSVASENGNYFRNMLYLFAKEYLYLIPLSVGLGGFLLIDSGLMDTALNYMFNIDFNASFIGEFFQFDLGFYSTFLILLVFGTLSIIISLMVAMVPFLLADEQFDQSKHNPLKQSMRMLKGHYVRLVLLRLAFVPWLVWLTLGAFIVVVLIFSGPQAFDGETTFIILYLLSIPFHFLFIQPFYTMVHVVLYSEIR